MIRGVSGGLVAESGLCTTWSGSFSVLPPVPPATLRETCVFNRFLWRAGEDPGALLNWTPGATQYELAHGTLYYALDPVPEPLVPAPVRFHTVGLAVQFTSFSDPLRSLCYDTGQNDRALVGNFKVPTAPFFPPVAWPFPGFVTVLVQVCCENDSTVAYDQPFSVSWRPS